jgi:dihydropteroate synthase
MRLRLRERTLEFAPGRPALMGIVNVGPDSFSDAVRLSGPEAAADHARALVADGADVIDIGAESGVTYSPVTPAADEASLLVPVVQRLAGEGIAVSVDTYKPGVAAAVLDAGAALINDTSGLRDPELARLCARHGAGLVVMHTRAAPKQKSFPGYGAGGVVADVVAFLRERVDAARAEGIDDEQLLLDPGPDFAKTPAESVAVLRDFAVVAELGRPVLAAISRKYVLGAITGAPPHDRLPETLAAAAFATAAGAAMLRVHDVGAVARHLHVLRVLRGEEELGAFDADDEKLKWIRPAPGVGSET